MKRIDFKTLFVMGLLAMLTQGSACDDEPSLNASALGAYSGPSHATGIPETGQDPNALDPNGEPSADADQRREEEANAAADGNGERGDACGETSDCGAGLDCAAGVCTSSGALRISLVWEVATDLDLHVITPSGEELYYRNREGQNGGRFEKDGCLADRCQAGRQIETVIWANSPVEGTYEFFAVNYDGDNSVKFDFDVNNEGTTESFSGSVAAGEGQRSSTFAVTVGGSTGTGELKISSHQHESWIRGPQVNFTVQTENADITRVNYTSDEVDLGSSTEAPNFRNSYSFMSRGEKVVKAKGYNGEDFELDNDEITLVITDANGGLPNPGQGAVVSERLLAKKIQEMGGINLYTIQVSGRNDGADSNSNIGASANNQTATNSCYGNAPCGRTRLNPKMLQAMYLLNQVHGYTFRVTSIAGGSHSAGSGHYSGNAFDVDTINGTSVSGNTTRARAFEATCRELGARLALGPGDAGHSTHVHCEW